MRSSWSKLYLLFVLILLNGRTVGLYGQGSNPYYFDGNDVVFIFDIREYAQTLSTDTTGTVDFADLGIVDVALSGNFNDWSKKGWRMKKTGAYTFELRKHVTSFNDHFPLEFRYIVNGRYVASVDGKDIDSKKFEDHFLEDVFKVDLSVLKVQPEGHIRFFLEGHPNASQVILAGSFNGWNEHSTKMNRIATGWELRGDLPPGRYEYKFIVDGEWTHDVANKEKVRNEHDTWNSVLKVTTPVVFELHGHPDARKVILAGSFNDWNENALRMEWADGRWIATVNLTGGKQLYKFIVDGEWMTNPANPLTEKDQYGNVNSVLFVK